MAIKKKVKRAPAGKSEAEIRSMIEEDFMQGAATPEQKAEMEMQRGSNAAARAANIALPERKALQQSTSKFKTAVSDAEIAAMSAKEFEEYNAGINKKKRKVRTTGL